VGTLIVHKPGSEFTDETGRVRIVGIDGEARLRGVQAREGVTTC
jgi:hypothetical protein